MAGNGANIAGSTAAGSNTVDTIVNPIIPSISSSTPIVAGSIATITVSSTATLFNGAKIRLDAGTANEEYTNVGTVVDGTHFTVKCVNAHPTSPSTTYTIDGDYHRQFIIPNSLMSDLGGYFTVAAASANGTAIGTLPTIYNGVELLIAPGASITFLKAFSAPGGAPAAGTTVTLVGPGAGNPEPHPIMLAIGQNLYVTAFTGTVQASYL